MFSPRQLYIAFIVAGSLCLPCLLWLDEVVAAIEFSATMVSVFSVLAALSNITMYMLVCIVLWTLGRRSFADSLFIVIAVSSTIAYSLKVFFGRARPFIDETGIFTYLSYEFDYTAFPSGTSSVAVGFACVLVRFFPALWPVALLFALIIGVSVIVIGGHFLSDVIMGWYVGAACASYMLWRLRTW